MKRVIFLMITLAVLFGIVACKQNKSAVTRNKNGKIDVTVTNFPPYDFVRQIAGDRVNLTMLLPPGSESHSFEPSPRDIITIQNSDIFIYAGGESDGWIDRILESMNTDNMKILAMIDTVEAVEEEIVEGMEDDDDHHHGHGEIDPANVKDRPMSDFNGSWISGIPLINDGSLDSYIRHTAEEKEVSPENQKAALLKTWASGYDNITISNNRLTANGLAAEYAYKGFSVVESHHGVSVWYQYQITGTVAGLPVYLAFNDHGDGNAEEHESDHDDGIAHMHMRYGNDGFTALSGAEDWSPYYFDSSYSRTAIGEFMTGHGHDEEIAYDEHVWTSPQNVILIVQAITGLLCETDPANAGFFRQNAAAYIKEMVQLDAAFKEVVSGAKRNIIVFAERFPFRYFADAYGLSYFAAFPGCSTETEPSAATVAFLINKIKAEKIPIVFHIELSNERMANTISGETGAKKLLLHSCHNITKRDFDSGLNYLEIMKGNVVNLREALY